MKKVQFFFLLFFIAVAAHADETPNLTKVFVENVLIGEIDPYEVGDACLIFVRTPDQKLYGLLNRDDACYDQEQALRKLRGTFVSVHSEEAEGITEVKKKSVLKILKSYNDKADYYYWNGKYEPILLTVSKLDIKKASHIALKKIKAGGDYIVDHELGGNSGFVRSFKVSDMNRTVDFKDEDILRRSFYFDSPNYIRTVYIDKAVRSVADLHKAAAFLLGERSYEDAKKRVEGVGLDPSRIGVFVSPDLLESDLRIFTGELDFEQDGLLRFYAIYDRDSEEAVVVVQGITE